MTPTDRIIALDREVIETRNAAARIIVNLLGGLSPDPKEREAMARAMEVDAVNDTQEGERTARLVAAKLREGR